MIDLYYWPTPNGRKVSILLEEIEVPYKIIPIDINNKKAKFFLNLEYWLSDQIYTQAAEKQELKV